MNQQYAQQLMSIITRAKAHLEGLDSRDFDYKSAPKKWSKKEIVGHLIDSAYNNHQRFLRASFQDNLVFQGYEQEQWVVRNNYQNRPKQEVIDTWFIVNQHLSHLIAGLPNELLNQQTTEHNFHIIGMNRPEKGELSSLSYLIWDYIFHLEHHLGQLLPNYEKQLSPFK